MIFELNFKFLGVKMFYIFEYNSDLLEVFFNLNFNLDFLIMLECKEFISFCFIIF